MGTYRQAVIAFVFYGVCATSCLAAVAPFTPNFHFGTQDIFNARHPTLGYVSLYQNPAMLGEIDRIIVSTQSMTDYFGYDQYHISAIFPMAPLYFGLSYYDMRASDNPFTVLGNQGRPEVSYYFSHAFQHVRFISSVRDKGVGVLAFSVKYYKEALFTNTSDGVSVDLGWSYPITTEWTTGIYTAHIFQLESIIDRQFTKSFDSTLYIENRFNMDDVSFMSINSLSNSRFHVAIDLHPKLSLNGMVLLKYNTVPLLIDSYNGGIVTQFGGVSIYYRYIFLYPEAYGMSPQHVFGAAFSL